MSSFEVVEFEPDRLIRIRTTGGTMPIDVTRRVTETSPGTSTVQKSGGSASGSKKIPRE